MNQLIQHTIRSVSLILTVLAALTLAACGNNGDSSGNDNSNPARNYLGTQAPGDVWSWTITTDSEGTGTFNASNDTLGNTYSGGVETLENGFLKLTVIATTDPAFVPQYALEFPGTALVIKPAGTGNAIVAVALGPCPRVSATYNWVDLFVSTWNPTTDQAYGVSVATVAGSTFNFSNTNYLLDGSSLGTSAVTGFTCSGGILRNSTDPTDPTVIVATPSGAFIGDNGPGAGGIVGMRAPASNIDWNDVVLAGREYRGVYFEDGNTDPAQDDTGPLWGRPNGSGGLSGGDWSDFEGNVETTTPAPGTIRFVAQNSPGIVNATLTDGAGTTPMVLMINRINGKYFIYGAQTNTSSGNGANFLAIEQ